MSDNKVVDTPLGKLVVWSNDASHIGLRTVEGSEYRDTEEKALGAVSEIVVNGIPYSLHSHFTTMEEWHKQNNHGHPHYTRGAWCAQYNDPHLRRTDKFLGEPSVAAFQKARRILTDWVAAYADTNEGGALLTMAQRRSLAADVDRATKELAEARDKLATAEEALADAMTAFAEVSAQ